MKSAKINSDKSVFVETEREADTFYEEDVLKQLRVGNTLMPKHVREKLEAEPYNINTVGQLKEYFYLQPQRWRSSTTTMASTTVQRHMNTDDTDDDV